MTTKKVSFNNFLFLNLSVLLISTSGPLGRYVALPPPLTICVRAFLGCLILVLFCLLLKKSFQIAKSDRWVVLFSGFLFGLHWVTYFYALQWSSVAIGMLSLYTYPVITALLEPLLLKTRFQKIHVLLGILVLIGIAFLIPNFDMANTTTKAIAIGVFSAFCYAIRNISLKKQALIYDGSVLMSYQLLVVFLLLIPVLFLYDLAPVPNYWQPIIALAFFTTAIGHTLFLKSFAHFSITTASIISCAQPIYGILIGFFFLNEIPTLNTIIGGSFVISAVVIESFRAYK